MKTTRNRLVWTLMTLLSGMFVCLPQAAVSGYIKDPAFGDDGMRLLEIGNFDDRGYAAALQADGKIVIAGMSENDAVEEVAVLRLTPSGALDASFSTNGWATYAMGAGDSSANDVVVMQDGSIIVGGAFQAEVGGSRQPAVMQLTSTGIVDIAFGPDGSGVTAIGEQEGEIEAMAVDPENRLVVAGTRQSDGRGQAFVARILPDGTLDTTFGNAGIRLVEDAAETSGAFVVLDDDGNIIIGGVRTTEEGQTAMALRFDGNGNIDREYGTDGQAVVEAGEIGTAFSSAVLLDDGSLLGAGYAVIDDRKEIMAVRLTTTGKPDEQYGAAGVALIDMTSEAVAHDIGLREDGTVVIIGETLADNGDIILVQLDDSGNQTSETVLRDAPSPSNDETEVIAAQDETAPMVTDAGGEDDSGRSVLVREGGGIIVAGFASDGVDDDIAVLAFTSDVPPEISGETDITKIPYLIATLNVTNITRNSGMSGGVISENGQFACDDSSDPDDCRPTVAERGVVYGVVPYPSYRTTEETTDSGTTSGEGTESNSVFPAWVTDSSTNYALVRHGQTSDGTGKGTYGSDITDITPEATYYVRAYALLSDETVVYGNQVAFTTDDACFIATAAYGSPLQSQVRVLRQFRDEYLKKSDAGRAFVGLYYHFSPKAADFISRSSILRQAVRIALVPLVAFSYFMVTFSLQVKLLLVLIGGGLFCMSQLRFSRR